MGPRSIISHDVRPSTFPSASGSHWSRPFSSRVSVLLLRTVKAEVIVFRNWDEMEQNKDKIEGKIVCFNNPWIDYYHSYEYRVYGASRVAKYGAAAMLVRSVASASIYSVHAGYHEYDKDQPKIPAAAITV